MDYDEEVLIVHFSAIPKPADYYTNNIELCRKFREDVGERRKFANAVLFPEYCKRFGTDRYNKTSTMEHCEARLKERLRTATAMYSEEWFNMWDQVVSIYPEMQDLADACDEERAPHET